LFLPGAAAAHIMSKTPIIAMHVFQQEAEEGIIKNDNRKEYGPSFVGQDK
jgi:hypothetical protein